jgi:diguanylate cyclase (GGDEF)-like protein
MKTVLLLDDDLDLRALLRSALTSEGLHVLEASSGHEAEEVLGRGPVDLVIVDGLLPDGPGLGFIDRLRRRDRRVRVVFVSAFMRDMRTFKRLTGELDVSLVIYKPVSPAKFARKVVELLEPRTGEAQRPKAPQADAATTALALEIAELHRQFAARLPARLAELEEAVRLSRFDDARLEVARKLAHHLRGSAGAYGFAAVGQAVGVVEDLLADLLEAPTQGQTRRSSWDEVSAAMAHVRLAAERSPEQTTWGMLVPSAPARALLVADEDPELLRMVKSAARKLAVEVVSAGSVDEVLRRAQTQPLFAAILEVHLQEEETFQLARKIRETAGHADIPIAFASADRRIQTRVAAIEAGGTKWDKPLTEERVVELLREFLHLTREQQGRVLIVDDAPDVTDHYSAHLRSAGFAVEQMASADAVVDRLEDTRPDVLLLDMKLPRVSGTDVCRALRMSERWESLPVLIVTAQAEPEVRRQAFRAGASDVIAKPVVPEELLARVRVHEERVRLLRERAAKDPLSGLMLRQAFLEAFQRTLAACGRDRKPLSLVLVDIDHLEEINDRYGHLAGDRVIARLGELLRRRFRPEDLRGRWGGEEFLIVFPGQATEVAVQAAQRLLLELGELRFAADDGRLFSVTFTAGVAGTPDDGSSLPALLRRAEERVLENKRARGGQAGKPPAAEREATGQAGAGTGGAAGGAGAAGEEKKLKVLLVDDEEDIRKIGRLSLEAVGKMQTVLAGSAAEAFELALAERPDVILLDIMMPGMDGLAALARVQKMPELRDIPVLFMTAKVQRTEVDHYLSVGALGVIQKPFDPMTLPDEIRRILGTRTRAAAKKPSVP